MANILCFGDSITQGRVDEFGGWTQRMRRYLDSKYKDNYGGDITPSHNVFNLGISGDTSEGLLKRIGQEINLRAESSKIIVVIAIGTNDSVFGPGPDDPSQTPSQFKQNIEAIIAQVMLTTSCLSIVLSQFV